MERHSERPDSLDQTQVKKIRINMKEFLEAFRDQPDDYYLMGKFSLKPKHLRKIYDHLMKQGLLGEDEYNLREEKSPEVEEKTASRATTPPASRVSTSPSTVVELQTTELCPQCNRAKHPDHPDSCPYCGVVFAKIKQSEKSEKVTVWVGDPRLMP